MKKNYIELHVNQSLNLNKDLFEVFDTNSFIKNSLPINSYIARFKEKEIRKSMHSESIKSIDFRLSHIAKKLLYPKV